MSYRDDLAAIEAHVESLRREARAKLDELERAQQLANEARNIVRKRVVEAELATPCMAAWDDMKGDERVRHCGQCKKNVYSVSELTRDEFDALIVKHEGRLCARFYLRADGTIVTKDCKSNIRMRPHKLALGLGAAALAAAALAVSCGTTVAAYHREKKPVAEGYWMGTTSFR
jgi:hypothetical protein